MSDLKFALRQLLKNPGFTTIAVLTLAVGIGANTSIFSIVDLVLLRPLPYEAAVQLVRVYESRPASGWHKGPISPPNFADWRTQSASFESLSAFNDVVFNRTGSGNPERLEATRVSANLFSLLRVQPLLGRTFSPDEERGGKVIILSHRLWQRRFDGTADAIGKSVTLDNENYTIVGVMPKGFGFPEKPDLWAPLKIAANEETSRGSRFLRAVGRIRPGVEFRQAQSEMQTIASRLAQEFGDNRGWTVDLVPMHEDMVANSRPSLIVLSAGVGFVLLIGCGNLANLFLAKSISRRREMALRAALGARRGRIIRQLLAESLLVALAGGVLGAVLALWGTNALGALIPSSLPRLDGPGIDLKVLLFTALISITTGILFGLLPALELSRTDLNLALKEGTRSSTGDRHRLHAFSIVSEVALALILLAGAGLLLRSFVRLKSVDPGFQAENVLTMQLSLPDLKYPQGRQQAAFFDQVIQRIQALPGVEHAAAAPTLPLTGGLNSYGFSIEGQATQPGEDLSSEHDAVTPDYFRALGIRLIQGRVFTDRDNAGASPVVIINQTAARRFFPSENPIGKRVKIAGPEPGEIVGIVADVKQYALSTQSPPHMYSPQSQKPSSYMTLFIRTSVSPLSIVSAVRQAVYSVDKEQPVAGVRTLSDVTNSSLEQRRFAMILITSFAGAALLLAAIGIYGVMAFAVVQRSREIGLRLALGAQRRDVHKMLVAQGMTLAGIGLALGLASSLGLGRMLSSMLFEVKPGDPITFLAISLLLTTVALLACWLPARRAAKLDPMEALRDE